MTLCVRPGTPRPGWPVPKVPQQTALVQRDQERPRSAPYGASAEVGASRHGDRFSEQDHRRSAMARTNLYELPAAADAPVRTWCGGNLGGDNETCVTTTQLAGMDAFAVTDSKPEGSGRELRMTGSELDTFAVRWARARGLTL